jgi:uncharacterized protein
VCIFSRQCGRAVTLEHNGNVYACDHYVYPEYALGNVLKDDLGRWSSSPSILASVRTRSDAATILPRVRRARSLLGGCPKHRFATSPYGEPGLHYLCPGYKKFFRR